MFKNSVFRVSVDTKKWFEAAIVRAVKTIAQAAIAGIGTAMAMGDVNWEYVLSAAALSGIISVLTSVAGIPEVSSDVETN